MSRLIDANKCFDAIVQWAADEECTPIAQGACKAAEIIASCPTVDAVEVVRCKDCRYATMTADGKFAKSCKIWTQARYFNANYFCADGERKEVDE